MRVFCSVRKTLPEATDMKKTVRILALLLVILICTAMVPFAGSAEETENDDYPGELKESPKDSLVDPWRFYNRECTSFVAWRLNDRNGVAFDNGYGGVLWGNAEHWDDAARSLGVTVDDRPAVGAVAYWEGGGAGHVAWVSSVEDGHVWVEEYNRNSDGAFHLRCVDEHLPDGYIHIQDLSAGLSEEAVLFAAVSARYHVMSQ